MPEPVAHVLTSFAERPRATWDGLYGRAGEGFDYYRACEEAPPPSFRLMAAEVRDGDRAVAGAPVFRVDFRLDMPLQGRLRPVGEWLDRYVPRLVRLPVLGLGSPHADRLSLGLDGSLDEGGKEAALEALIAALVTHARGKQTRADIVVVKDVTESQAQWAGGILRRQGFARIPTLPVAVLQLPFRSAGDYIASLSQNQRSSLRRKLKKARAVRVEVRSDIGGLERRIEELHEATRTAAAIDYGPFEEVAPGYFASVTRHLGGRARALLYWLGDELIGFSLVLLEPGRLVFPYVGLRYPAAREHAVYFLNWMTMVELCLAERIPVLHAGQTTYVTKCRLGCELERTWIYFRARNRAWNLIVKALGPLFAIDRMDPDLKELGARARYVSLPPARSSEAGVARALKSAP